MSNRSSIALGLLIICALVLDSLVNQAAATLFLARKLEGLIEWSAFWR